MQVVGAVKGIWLDYFQLVNVRQENKRLSREIDSLKMENSRYRELLATYERLRELFYVKEKINLPAIEAQVTGMDPSGLFKSIIISKGKAAGLRLDMPVIHTRGVVGRIVSLSKHYAKVLLIIDQNSAVDCLVQRSRARGMTKGLTGNICKLDYVAESSDVSVGDVVITSGLGGVFPKGLTIGHVSKINKASTDLFQDIEITPAVDFSKLEEVLVILEDSPSSNHQIKKR
jgi:rod shape-determining protein MreC